MDNNKLPQWVLKYRTKGHSIKHLKNGYALYKCTSVYVPGSKYPKSKQTFLGMITEKDGFIPKKTKSGSRDFIEYGLSAFILRNFSRELGRSLFNRDPNIITLSIIKFIFGNLYADSVRCTYLSHGHEDELISLAGKINSDRIDRMTIRISELITKSIPDEEERSAVITHLRLAVMERGMNPPAELTFSPEIMDIIERNGLKL